MGEPILAERRGTKGGGTRMAGKFDLGLGEKNAKERESL